MAQDSRLADWLAVPPQRAGIVLSIDFPVSEVTISSDGKVLASKKWIPNIPFVWQLRVEPDIYQIRLQQGPIASIGVIAKQPASLTYVRLAPIKDGSGNAGLSAVVTTGPTPPALIYSLENATKFGIPDAFRADFIEAGNRVLLLNTEPPWPIPPPPKR